jgi:hypothetical protein
MEKYKENFNHSELAEFMAGDLPKTFINYEERFNELKAEEDRVLGLHLKTRLEN